MRIALGIEYDGTDFLGWQRLGHGASVQAKVEEALTRVADQTIHVICAGRTDAGVHSRCQVVHFDTKVQRDLRGWVLGACSHLPSSVAVLWAKVMPEDFHARFCARSRRYRYTILNRAVRPALGERYVAWERRPLDANRMHAAAQALLGEHDFSAFRAVSCQAAHARREVKAMSVRRTGEEVIVEIEANAFLHHMVRNIAGVLMAIGQRRAPVEWAQTVLDGRVRAKGGVTAAPGGLYFVGPVYPAQFGLPVAPHPWFPG